MTRLPQFSTALLHPRYWPTWAGIGLLWLLVQLPYPVIYRIGCGLGHLAQRFMKRRVKIANRNLELCFPDMGEQERERMLRKNFESVGMGLMETGMAWFWPDKRMARWFDVTGTGMEPVHTLQAEKNRRAADWHSLPDARNWRKDVWHADSRHRRLSPER